MSLARSTTRCIWYQIQRHAISISSNKEVSERFVGSSLRIVLAPIAPYIVPAMCSGFVSDVTNQIPFSHGASHLWILFPDDNPRRSGVETLNKKVFANGTISCV